jgi:hypothetical protein
MAPIQREGMDYEFTTVLDMDVSHNAVPSKDRTGLFDGKIFIPSSATGEALKNWLETGIEPPKEKKEDVPNFTPPPEESTPAGNVAVPDVISEAQGKRLFALSSKSELPIDKVKLFLMHYYGLDSSKKIPKTKYEEICDVIQSKEKFDTMMKDIAA